MKQLNRIEYIDIFRSFGIIAMIMGHVGYGNTFDFFIHAFHMPMFFWISGFLFKHRSKSEMSFRTWLLKKARTLLLPYIVFGIAHYLLEIFIDPYHISISTLVHLISVNTYGLPICGALWFLTALFLADMLFFIIDRYIVYEPLKALTIAAIALLGNSTKSLFPSTLPLALGPAFVGLGLYYIGYLFRKNEENKFVLFLLNLPWFPNLLLGAITVVLIFLNGYINMRTETYAIIPLFWVNAILSIIVGINFSKFLYTYIQNNVVGKWLVSVGRESIVYVCLNQVVILIVKKAFRMSNLPTHLASIMILILTLVSLWIISKTIMHTRLKLLIGK